MDVDTGKESYSPIEIMGILRDSGIPTPEDSVESVVYSIHAQGIIDLLQKIHLKYLRSNALSLNDHRLSRIFGDAHWEELHRLLVSHEIVREEARETSGPQNIFLRNIISFADLMKLELQPHLPQNRLGQFWCDVRNM